MYRPPAVVASADSAICDDYTRKMMFHLDKGNGLEPVLVLLLPVLHGEKVGMRGCLRRLVRRRRLLPRPSFRHSGAPRQRRTRNLEVAARDSGLALWAPRNDMIQRQHRNTSSPSRDAFGVRALHRSCPPSAKRAQGRPGGRMHPGLSRKTIAQRARKPQGTGGDNRPSLRDGLRLIARSPR